MHLIVVPGSTPRNVRERMVAMSEINVIAIFHAKPEHREELIAAYTEMAEQTHANDEGCLLYALQQSTTDPNVLAFIEKWASEEALDAHAAKPHIADGTAARDAMMSEPRQVIKLRSLGAGTPELGLF